MHTIRNYIMAESLEQAWELNQKGRNNIIIGGNLWLKMGRRNITVSKCSYRKLLYSYFKRMAGDTHITKRQDYHNFTYNRVVFCGMLHRGIYQSIYIKEDFWYFYIGLCSGMENIKIFMYNN